MTNTMIIIEVDDDEATVNVFEGVQGRFLPALGEPRIFDSISLERGRATSSDAAAQLVANAVRKTLRAERDTPEQPELDGRSGREDG